MQTASPEIYTFPYTTLFRSTDSEKELSDALEMYVRRAGGTCASFPAIVAVGDRSARPHARPRSEEHTSELQSLTNLVCRLLLEKKKQHNARKLPPPATPRPY